MKKVMKKIISTLFVLAMLLIQIVPATSVNAQTFSGRGTEDKGSITINKAIKDKTYTIYRIFDLESYSYDMDDAGKITNKAFVYKVASKWSGFINQASIKGVYVEVSNDNIVTWVSGADQKAFAKLAIEYAKTNGIANDGQKPATTEEVVFDELPLGYYLVDSTVGTLCGLDTTKPSAIISEKNDVPTIDKKVNNNGTWDKESNAKIGDTVEYETTIIVKAGAEKYKLTDIMTAGLTPNEDVKVTVNNTLVSTNNYTVIYENNGFVLTLNDEYVSTLPVDTKIIVTYSATLNENAVVCKVGNCGHNDNRTYLEYGDNNRTNEDSTKTYTYEFNLVKTKSDGTTQLEGAEFKLYDAETNGNEIIVYMVREGVYRVAKTSEELAKKTTIKAGNVMIEGLDSDETYYLEEVVQPAGYNRLTNRVEVKIVPSETKDEVTTIELTKVVVKNYTGTELPSTGGMGTVLFVTIGSILVLGFGVLLVTKLRVSKMSI